MPIVQKRTLKYFSNRDGSPLAVMLDQNNNNVDLLQTIKLTKNVFKLTLPSASYEIINSYATMPVA